MLGAAQADALGAVAAGAGGVRAVVGVGEDLQPTAGVGVPQQVQHRVRQDVVRCGLAGLQRRGDLARPDVEPAAQHLAGAAVHGDDLALGDASMPSGPVMVRASRSTTSPVPTTQVRPMPRATTAACDVTPPREVTIACAATIPARSSGLVSVRTSTTSCPSAARRAAVSASSATSPTAAPALTAWPVASDVVVAGVDEPRVHQRLELRAGDPHDGLVEVDEALALQVARDAEGRGRSPLADAGLQQPQPTELDGELDVADVAVVALQRLQVLQQLGVHRRAASRPGGRGSWRRGCR